MTLRTLKLHRGISDMSDDRQAIEFSKMPPAISLWAADAAIAKYQGCVRLDPEYFDAWHALGMALMKAGRFPEAIDAAFGLSS